MALTKECGVVAVCFNRPGAGDISRNAPQGPRIFTRPENPKGIPA